jgi:two-component system nitrate/nitrite response regulator NarL
MTKILVVVEDDADIRFLIKLMLRADGRLEVMGEAATADEAIALARTEQPGLIILDHYIEGTVMGLDAVPALKEAAPAARILLFSSHDLSAEVARQPLVDAFLRKDRMDDLLTTVQRLLELEPVPS